MAFALEWAIAFIKRLSQERHGLMDMDSVLSAYGMSEDPLIAALKDIQSLQPGLLTLENKKVILNYDPDFLDEQVIYRKVSGKGRVQVVDCIDSTNTSMLQNAANLTCGDVLLAEFQTAGRGRRGGKWLGALGSSLMLSLSWIFKGDFDLRGLSVSAGVAAAKALQPFCSQKISVKWPNDLYMGEKKLGGILIESVCFEKKAVVIVGIGINVYPQKDNEISIYASLLKKTQRGERNNIAAALIDALRSCCRLFSQEGLKAFKEDLMVLNHLLGREISLCNGEHRLRGIVQGIDDDGALLLENSDGLVRAVAGHIEKM